MPVNDSNLTDGQEIFLTLLPILPAILSIAGSSAILVSVIRSRFAGPPHKRFLFGMSISDIFGSFTMMFQAVLVPKQSSYRVWAIGNDATCTVMGAMTQMGVGTLFYTLSLSIWYLASIRYGISAPMFSKYAEPWMHVLSIGYPLATAIYGATVGVFHELDIDLGCWVSDYPEGCDVDRNDNIPCKSVLIGYVFAGYPYFISFAIILVNKILIVLHVWKGTTTTALPNNNNNTAHAVGAITTTTNSAAEGRNNRVAMRSQAQVSRARSVAAQSLLYVGAFLLTFFCAGIIRVLETLNVGLADEPGGINDEQKLFPLLVINRILFPSVGTLNLFVFLRPQYVRVRARHKELSRIGAFRRALKDCMDVQKLQSRRERLARSSFSSRYWMDGSELATSSTPQHWFRRSMSSSRRRLSARHPSGNHSGSSEDDMIAHIGQAAASWISAGSSDNGSIDSVPAWEDGPGMVAMTPEPIREEDEEGDEEEDEGDVDDYSIEEFDGLREYEIDVK